MSGHGAVSDGGKPVKIHLKFKNTADSPSWTLADALISNKDSNISKVGVKERTFDTRTMTRLTTTVTPPRNSLDSLTNQSNDKKINGPLRPSFDTPSIKYGADASERNAYLPNQLDDKPIYSSTITISKRVYDPREKEVNDFDRSHHGESLLTNNISRVEDQMQNINFSDCTKHNGLIHAHEDNSQLRNSTLNHQSNLENNNDSIPKLYIPTEKKIPKLIHPSRNSLNAGSPYSRENQNLLIDRAYGTYNGPFMTREESYNLQRSFRIHGNSPILNGHYSPSNTQGIGNTSGYVSGNGNLGSEGGNVLNRSNRNTGVVSRDLENLMDSIELYNQSANNQPIYSEVNKQKKESDLGSSRRSLSDNQQYSYQPTGTDNQDGLTNYHQGGEMRFTEGTAGPLGRQGKIDGKGDSREDGLVFQKGDCAACGQAINGQVLMALDKMWHVEHFICDGCNQPLSTQIFFEREGKVFCERDYQDMFCPKCASCNQPILDKCIKALDKSWHPDHFRCAQCYADFGLEGYHEMNGKPYCSRDFFAMFAPKCGMCGQAITESYVSALQRQWHPECFVCMECRSPFTNGSFFADNGRPFCERHFHAIRGSLCHHCCKPIVGRCMTAMNRKYHPDHFLCSFCRKPITKGTFKEQQEKPYCHDCFDKLFA